MAPGKMAPGKKATGKMAPWKNDPRKTGTRKIGPRKNGPRKIGPRKTHKRKIVGWASSIVVCVWNVINLWKPKTWQQSQNSETYPQHGNKKSCGERRASWCMCVECSDVINLWKPKTRQQTQNWETRPKLETKIVRWALSDQCRCDHLWKSNTRQQIFLDSFTVLQFGTYFFVCVVKSIDKNEKVVSIS